jgi:hypothetical protein
MHKHKWKKRLSIALSIAMVSTMLPIKTPLPIKQSTISTVLADDTSPSSNSATPTETPVLSCGLTINMNLSTSQATISKVGGMAIDDVFYYQIVSDSKNVPQPPSAKKWVTAVVDTVQGNEGAKEYLLDFSWLSYSKAQTLYVTTNIDPAVVTPTSFHMTAQIKDLKFKYTSEKPEIGMANVDYIGSDVTGYLSLDKAKTYATITDLTTIEWKTVNGDWKKLINLSTPTLNLNDYINKGTTLYFRNAATRTEPFSKTVTMKLSAPANGPKISINTTNKTVTFPAGSEYILSSNYAQNATWTKFTVKTTKPFTEIATINGTSDVYIYVRKSATSRKVASKITIVALFETTKADTSIDTTKLITKYNDQKLYVPFGQNKVISYNFSKKEKQPTAWENLYISDAYSNVEGGNNLPYGLIDVSSLNPTVDNWIYFKGDHDNKVTFIKIEKTPVLRAKFAPSIATLDETQKAFVTSYSNFTAETGYYYFTADNLLMTSGANILWKLENGTWSDLSALHLEHYKYKGTKLYFMLKGDTKLCSKPIKFSHSARPNSTSAKLDGNKLTINLSKKIEYRVKVENGTYSNWTSVDTTKSSINLPIGQLVNMTGNGDGISTQWKNTTLMIRLAATNKKTPSNVAILPIYAPTEPVCGADGLSMQYVTANTPSSGMRFTNKSSVDYQIAVISGGDNPETAIAALDYTANSKQAGYVKFKTVKAGKYITVAYKEYKSLNNPFPICRIATIREDAKTIATEFRIASVVENVIGSTPKCNLTSGMYPITGGNDSISVPVTFTIANGWTVYYTTDGKIPTADDNFDSVNRYTGKFNVTISKGEQVSIHAIGVKLDNTNKIIKTGGTLEILLTGYKAGDKSEYINKWGYKLCLKDDQNNNNSMASNLYTMAYDAITAQLATFDISSLEIGKSNSAFITKVLERVRYDNPQLLQYSGGYSYSYNSTKMLSISPKYKQDAATTATMMNEVNETYQKIVTLAKSEKYGNSSNFTSIPDIQKVKAIHDYLVLNNKYAKSTHDQDIYGAMSEKSSPVCMSYAMSFLYCCQKMGIECVLVVGYAGEGHAWNLVRLENGDGKDTSDDWYEMDVTWDDPVGTNLSPDYLGTACFNVTTDFISTYKKRRTRYYSVYTEYPVDKATGTTFSANTIYPASYNASVDNIAQYGCGLELPKVNAVPAY